MPPCIAKLYVGVVCVSYHFFKTCIVMRISFVWLSTVKQRQVIYFSLVT